VSAASTSSFDIRRQFAPGTPLRNAVDLILRQGTGALIVLGSGAAVDAVCSGGFHLIDTRFTAQRLAELAKMDGGIVVDELAEYIVRANVQFIPDTRLDTAETGTRFRTAERLALQTEFPVLSVSEEGRSAAIVFLGDERYELRQPTQLLAQANQTLNSIERVRRRLQEAEDRLTRLEVDDVVTVRDVAVLLQRAALVHRLSAQVDQVLIELGGEAQLIRIQSSDLLDGVDTLAELVYEDYARRRTRGKRKTSVFDRLDGIATEDLFDASRVAAAVNMDPLDTSVRPRGIRALAGVPRLPEGVKEALLSHFKTLRKMLAASVTELDAVDGVGTARAEQLRAYFDRMSEVGTVGP
jgi:diadenylate cyclase